MTNNFWASFIAAPAKVLLLLLAIGHAAITAVAISGGSPLGLGVGLQASAGRGFSPPTCIVLYLTVSELFVRLWTGN